MFFDAARLCAALTKAMGGTDRVRLGLGSGGFSRSGTLVPHRHPEPRGREGLEALQGGFPVRGDDDGESDELLVAGRTAPGEDVAKELVDAHPPAGLGRPGLPDHRGIGALGWHVPAAGFLQNLPPDEGGPEDEFALTAPRGAEDPAFEGHRASLELDLEMARLAELHRRPAGAHPADVRGVLDDVHCLSVFGAPFGGKDSDVRVIGGGEDAIDEVGGGKDVPGRVTQGFLLELPAIEAGGDVEPPLFPGRGRSDVEPRPGPHHRGEEEDGNDEES